MKAHLIPEYTTITEAARLTGMDTKTVRKRIEGLPVCHVDGSNKLYRTKDLIRNLFIKTSESEQGERVLSKEKADYYYELKLKTRLEREKLAEKYVDAESFNIDQTKRFLSFKEKLLNVSLKLGPKVSRKDPETATSLMDEAIREALSELVEDEIERLRLLHDNIEKHVCSPDEADDEFEAPA